jgi:hypothetical protein
MQIVTGPLETGNFTMYLDGIPLSTTKTNVVSTKKIHTLSLRTTSDDAYFRGFLFRLGKSDVSFVVDPSDLSVPGDASTKIDQNSTSSIGKISWIVPSNYSEAQLAGSCLLHNASGIGHVNQEPKKSVTGLLQITEEMFDLALDVTVVVRNRNHRSVFYYTGYTLDANDMSNVWQREAMVVPAVNIFIVTVAVLARNVLKKRKRSQGKKNYFELTSVKLAEDGDRVSGTHIDTAENELT